MTFTQGQKDQIAAMVEAGDTMGAQKIILHELKTEFGGAAKAAVDPWQRVGVVMGEVKEQIGTALLPVMDRVAAWLAVKIPQAVAVLQEALRAAQMWWVRNKDAVMALAGVFADFYTPAVGDATGKTKDMSSTAEQLLGMIKGLMEGVLRAIQVWLWFERQIEHVISGVASFITATGHAINAVDRLTGGTGHAGDSMVRFGEDLKNTGPAGAQGGRGAVEGDPAGHRQAPWQEHQDQRHHLAAVHQDVHLGRLVPCPPGRRPAWPRAAGSGGRVAQPRIRSPSGRRRGRRSSPPGSSPRWRRSSAPTASPGSPAAAPSTTVRSAPPAGTSSSPPGGGATPTTGPNGCTLQTWSVIPTRPIPGSAR